jgi:signal transduction histidine kinase
VTGPEEPGDGADARSAETPAESAARYGSRRLWEDGESSSRTMPRPPGCSYAAAMAVVRLPLQLVVVVFAASAAGAAAFAVAGARTAVDWAFTTVVLSALGLLTLRVVREWREARREAARARVLARLVPDDVAREAVRAERRLLLGEISSGLRDLLLDVREAAGAGSVADDPRSAAEHIHERSREATAELRRQLGLLRPVEEPAPSSEEAARARTPARLDVSVGVAAALLAMVETVLWPTMDGQHVSAATVVMGGMAAGTVVGVRAWPVMSALACAGVFLLGTSLSVPIYPGIWFLASVCGLLWAVAGVRRPAQAAGAVVALVGAVLAEVALSEPQNVAFDAVVMGVAVVGGLLARAARSRARTARERAADADSQIATAAREAVGAERAVFARELHDTVSHAVGLIAMQSAAVLVSADHDPDAARASLGLVRRTADTALADLDDAAILAPRPRTRSDLDALVERIRAAGTQVELEVVGRVGPQLPEPVYRVVQEALTNVVRHAPGARARVRIATAAGQLVVEVTDDGPGVVAGAERGYGLVGLGERVRFVGGSLATSPGPGGAGFRVRATVPHHAEVPA